MKVYKTHEDNEHYYVINLYKYLIGFYVEGGLISKVSCVNLLDDMLNEVREENIKIIRCPKPLLTLVKLRYGIDLGKEPPC